MSQILQNRDEVELKRLLAQLKAAMKLQHDVGITDTDIYNVAFKIAQYKDESLMNTNFDNFSIPELFKIMRMYNSEQSNGELKEKQKTGKEKSVQKGH